MDGGKCSLGVAAAMEAEQLAAEVVLLAHQWFGLLLSEGIIPRVGSVRKHLCLYGAAAGGRADLG